LGSGEIGANPYLTNAADFEAEQSVYSVKCLKKDISTRNKNPFTGVQSAKTALQKPKWNMQDNTSHTAFM
jgi:hypothetical protein